MIPERPKTEKSFIKTIKHSSAFDQFPMPTCESNQSTILPSSLYQDASPLPLYKEPGKQKSKKENEKKRRKDNERQPHDALHKTTKTEKAGMQMQKSQKDEAKKTQPVCNDPNPY